MGVEVSRRGFLAGAAGFGLAMSAGRIARGAEPRPTLRFRPLDLKLAHRWTIARGSTDGKRNGLLSLEAEGTTGFGEAAPNVRYGQSFETAEAAFGRVVKATEGLSPWEHRAWLERAEQAAGPDSEVVAALDMALWDWKGKRVGKPVHALLGVPSDRMAVTTYSIGIDTLEVMKAKVKEAAAYPQLKVKLGTANDEDIVRGLRAITDKPIRVDANEGWKTADEAIRKIAFLESQHIEFVEQPLPAARNSEMRAVKAASHLPLVADESVLHPGDVAPLVGLFDGLNVKLAKCGGITRACELAAVGRALGFKLMLGCMVESSLGIAAAIAVAPLFDWLDIDGNLLLAADPFRGLAIREGRWRLPDAPGLGVVAV